MKRLLLPLLLLAGCGAPPSQSLSETVELRVVKWPDLEAHLLKQHGKVVLIDVWFNTCLPCKKEFPHFVEMHHKYSDRGLVCISLNTSEPEEKANALTFLKKQQATFDNFLIDEPIPVWQQKLHSATAPAALIFNPDGKLRKDFGDEEFTYIEVEQEVIRGFGRTKQVYYFAVPKMSAPQPSGRGVTSAGLLQLEMPRRGSTRTTFMAHDWPAVGTVPVRSASEIANSAV